MNIGAYLIKVKSLRRLKIRRVEKSLRQEKIRRIEKSLRQEKIRRIEKSLQALKSPRLVKTRVCRKAGGTGKAGGLLTV
jgi:hypothetical protein